MTQGLGQAIQCARLPGQTREIVVRCLRALVSQMCSRRRTGAREIAAQPTRPAYRVVLGVKGSGEGPMRWQESISSLEVS